MTTAQVVELERGAERERERERGRGREREREREREQKEKPEEKGLLPWPLRISLSCYQPHFCAYMIESQ